MKAESPAFVAFLQAKDIAERALADVQALAGAHPPLAKLPAPGTPLPWQLEAVLPTPEKLQMLHQTEAATRTALAAVADACEKRVQQRSAEHLLLGPLAAVGGGALQPIPTPLQFMVGNARAIHARLQRLRVSPRVVEWAHLLWPRDEGALAPLNHAAPVARTALAPPRMGGAAFIQEWVAFHSAERPVAQGGSLSRRPPPHPLGRAVHAALQSHGAVAQYGTRKDMTATAAAEAALPFELECVTLPGTAVTPAAAALSRNMHALQQLTLSEYFPDYCGHSRRHGHTCHLVEYTGGLSLAQHLSTPLPSIRAASAPTPQWVAAITSLERSSDTSRTALAQLQDSTLQALGSTAALGRTGRLAAGVVGGQSCSIAGSLCESQALFRWVAGHVCRALADVLTHTCYTLRQPLTVDNVFLSEGGTRVTLGGIPWGDPLPAHASPAQLRQRGDVLLASLGNILAGMLGGDEVQHEAGAVEDAPTRVVTRSGAAEGLVMRCKERVLLALPWDAAGVFVWSTPTVAGGHDGDKAPPLTPSPLQLYDAHGQLVHCAESGAAPRTWADWRADTGVSADLALMPLTAAQTPGTGTLLLFHHAAGDTLPDTPALVVPVTVHSPARSAALQAILQLAQSAERRLRGTTYAAKGPSHTPATSPYAQAAAALGLSLPGETGGHGAAAAGGAATDAVHVGSLVHHPYFDTSALQHAAVVDDYARHFHMARQVASGLGGVSATLQ